MKSGDWEFSVFRDSSNVGVVLVHEVFGFDSYIESVAYDLAKAGFSVAVVDLYRGKHASDLEEAFSLRSSLKEQDVLGALQMGLHLLREQMPVYGKIGSMGFCMGGGFALLGACNLDFDFCIDYYGLIDDADLVKGVKGPIQLILASEDERVTPWAYQKLLPAATTQKKRVDVHLYPNARHAFHRPNWDGHSAEAASDAWSKTVVFLSQFKTK